MVSLIPVRNKRKLDEHISSSASTSLTDLSDELLTLILENLDFRKRSVTRRVCRTLCRVADSLPPPEELQVEFFRCSEEYRDPESLEWHMLNMRGHFLEKCNLATTNIDINLDHPGPEDEYLLQLRAIRPVQLKLGAISGISSDLLRRVADQVTDTVTSLSVARLKIESPLAFYDAFSPFRNNARLTDLPPTNRQCTRTKLYLERHRNSLLFIIITFSLNNEAGEMITFTQCCSHSYKTTYRRNRIKTHVDRDQSYLKTRSPPERLAQDTLVQRQNRYRLLSQGSVNRCPCGYWYRCTGSVAGVSSQRRSHTMREQNLQRDPTPAKQFAPGRPSLRCMFACLVHSDDYWQEQGGDFRQHRKSHRLEDE
jgi:hypothetical protein